MGASFRRPSTGKFEKDTSIVSIFHGTDSYLLEDELNESQWLQIEKTASILREQYTNGFMKKFNIKTDGDNVFYIESNDEKPLSLLVDGYHLLVGENKAEHYLSAANRLIVELPEITNSHREDLVFLEVWFESVSYADKLRKFGGEDTPEITLKTIQGSQKYNNLIDARINTETTRRIQLKWRVRVVENGDFEYGVTANKYDNTDSNVTYQKYEDIYVADLKDYQTSQDGSFKASNFVYAVPLFKVTRQNTGSDITLEHTSFIPSVSYKEENTLTEQILDPEKFLQNPDHQLVSEAEKARWNDTYTKDEVDSKVNVALTNLKWQESVPRYEDLEIVYPNPEKDFTVTVEETNETYHYDGTKWVKIYASMIPKATSSIDGLMSAEDKAKLNSIESYANYYEHPSHHTPDIILQNTNNRFVTDLEKVKWSNKYTKEETDNKINSLVTNLIIDKVVEKEEDIETEFPEPNEGAVVYVNSTNTIKKFKDSTWVDVLTSNLKWGEQVERYEDLPLDPEENQAHFVANENKVYKYSIINEVTEETDWVPIASSMFNLATDYMNGLMSTEDKKTLEELKAHLYGYPAFKIDEDELHRFVTDEEKERWNNRVFFGEVEPPASKLVDGLIWVNTITKEAKIYQEKEDGSGDFVTLSTASNIGEDIKNEIINEINESLDNISGSKIENNTISYDKLNIAVRNIIEGKADKNNVYTKSEINNLLKNYNPGTGGGNGSGGSGSLISYRNTVILESETNEAYINIEQFNKNTDVLMVFANSVYLNEDDDYTIDVDEDKIIKTNGTWQAGTEINFLVLASLGGSDDGSGSVGPISMDYFTSEYIASSDGEVTIPITFNDYDPYNDTLQVYQKNLMLYPDINYTEDTLNKTIVLNDYYLDTGDRLVFVIWKKIQNGSHTIVDRSVISYHISEYIASGGESYIPVTFENYVPKEDILQVYQKNLLLYEGVNYDEDKGNKAIVLRNYTLKENERLVFIVWKRARVGVGVISEIEENSVTNDKLAEDIKIGSLVDLNTNNKANVIDAINEVNKKVTEYNVYNSSKDSNGIFLVTEYKRTTDDSLYIKSTLSNPDANNNYQTVTVEEYDIDGETLLDTKVWTLTYDADGDVISRVLNN